MRKNFKTILTVLLLILFDQAIKIFIFKNLMKNEFPILGEMLTFKPYINTKYSWFNSFSNMDIGLLPHIILNITIILILIIVFAFIQERYIINNFIHYLCSFLCAGVFCSLIDKVAWGGSLDYIKLKGLFIFDLKDIYISIFEIIIILSIILNYKKLKEVNEKEIYDEFKTYIKMKCSNKYI